MVPSINVILLLGSLWHNVLSSMHVEKRQNVGRITRRALRIPPHLQWDDYVTCLGKGWGLVISDKYKQT